MTLDEIFRDRFSKGDKVVWRDDFWASHNDGKRLYGGGPFKVLAVEEVAESQVAGVGHTQFVRLKSGTYSGAYFRKVEETHG